MIFMGCIWGWVLATVCGLISSSDHCSTEQDQVMDDLSSLMDYRGLSSTLRRRSRRHLYEAFYVNRMRHQQRTMQWLSSGLRGEIALESGLQRICRKIWYMADAKP